MGVKQKSKLHMRHGMTIILAGALLATMLPVAAFAATGDAYQQKVDQAASEYKAQSQALDAFYVDGIRHNIPFLSSLMQHDRWRKGALSTGFIAEEYPDGFSPLVAEGEKAHAMAAVAAAVDHVANERKR